MTPASNGIPLSHPAILFEAESSAVVGFFGQRSVLARVLFRRFLISVVASSPPGRSVVSQSMTTARRGVSMVRAQWTAWSERRSQGGASAVVITGFPFPAGCWVVVFSTADHTDTDSMRRYYGAYCLCRCGVSAILTAVALRFHCFP